MQPIFFFSATHNFRHLLGGKYTPTFSNCFQVKEKEFLPLIERRLGITQLNPMQRRMMEAASEKRDIILLSPTGTGKTLAFTLPMLKIMRPTTGRVQAIVIAPSRELVLQTAGVLREIAAGLKVTPLYGGHKVEDELNSLKAGTDIIVATPGRLLDHIRRRNIDVLPTRLCILDEFDKSLELGFEDDMKHIFERLKNLSRIILTSATDATPIPSFVKLDNPLRLSFTGETKAVRSRQRIHKVESDSRDKLQSLLTLLRNLSAESPIGKSIIFVNHRESAERIHTFLTDNNADSTLYHGGLDQIDREKAVAMFNNASRPLLVATDLAARGLDIAAVENIIHYHQPLQEETYTHRNGRTARIDRDGDIFVLIAPGEDTAPFINFDDTFHVDTNLSGNLKTDMQTLYISSGKKEKISRGDILGFLTSQEGIEGNHIGKIDVYDHYSLVAIHSTDAAALLAKGRNFRIKGSNRRIQKA